MLRNRGDKAALQRSNTHDNGSWSRDEKKDAAEAASSGPSRKPEG
jgi:hypothetical protein